MLPGPSSPHDRADPTRSVLPSASLDSERVPSPNRPGPSRIQHTLPPIRELHPGLPLSSPIPLSPTAASGPGPGHLQLHGYPVASASTLGECSSRLLLLLCLDSHFGRLAGPRRSVDDSDAEGDAQEPPKKKRRRQALSCTGAGHALI